jgi:inner membrane protein
MATTWTHAFFALAGGKAAIHRKMPLRFWFLTAVCAAIPDLDVFWQRLVPDHSGIWVHRGVTHSLLAAVLIGLLAACVGRAWGLTPGAAREETGAEALPGRTSLPHPARGFLLLWLAFTLATASHAMLDMLSAGYRGVELLAPFSDQRFSFPWQPIWSFPQWLQQMFPSLQGRGMRGLWLLRASLSELIVVWIPMTALVVLSRLARRLRRASRMASVPVTTEVRDGRDA